MQSIFVNSWSDVGKHKEKNLQNSSPFFPRFSSSLGLRWLVGAKIKVIKVESLVNEKVEGKKKKKKKELFLHLHPTTRSEQN